MRNLAAVAALALAACFNPTFNNPACGPNGECPSGTTCVQNVCREMGSDIDAPVDTPNQDPDASPDSAVDAATDAAFDAAIDAAIDAATDGTPTDGTPIDAAMTCPNGTREGTEECDDNNTVNTDDCTAMCRLNVCGDGFTDTVGSRTDTCDDGNLSNADNCVDISGQCRPSVCGDGYTDTVSPGVEECDDGNANNNDACRNNCTINTCGDGVIQGTEACDDHNNNACGTCSLGCTTSVTARAATGSIQDVQEGSHFDQDFFTLNDGINPPTLFEYDRSQNGVTAGRVPITFATGSGPGQVAMATIAAINGVGGSLLITAGTQNGGLFPLTHDRLTSLGNLLISDNVNSGAWVSTGMSGGAAGDCASGVGCSSNNDCASGVCTAAVCQ